MKANVPLNSLEPKTFQFTITQAEVFSNKAFVLYPSLDNLISEIANKRLWEEIEKLVLEGYWIEEAFLKDRMVHNLTIHHRDMVEGRLFTCCILTKKLTEDELYTDKLMFFIDSLDTYSKPKDKEQDWQDRILELKKAGEGLQQQIDYLKSRKR